MFAISVCVLAFAMSESSEASPCALPEDQVKSNPGHHPRFGDRVLIEPTGSGTRSHQVLVFPGRPIATPSGIPPGLMMCLLRGYYLLRSMMLRRSCVPVVLLMGSRCR
jgi:hypothetical protein